MTTRPVIGVDLPDVVHCDGHRRPLASLVTVANSTCAQCDGTHDHLWVTCTSLARLRSVTREPIRCVVCGGRKCSAGGCISRLGHADMHVMARGRVTDSHFLPED